MPIERSGGGGGGTTSPLTTKGDIWGFDTGNNRIPVGTNNQYLISNSAQSLGVQWATGGVQRIYDFTVTGAAKASIDTNVDGSFAGLFPTTGVMLGVFFVGRTDEAVILSGLNMTFNNDSGANYARGVINSSQVDTTAHVTQTSGETAVLMSTAGASMAANVPGMTQMWIPAYADTTFFKVGQWTEISTDTVTGLTHREILFTGTVYSSTSAITRIKAAPATAGKNLVVGSRLIVTMFS